MGATYDQAQIQILTEAVREASLYFHRQGFITRQQRELIARFVLRVAEKRDFAGRDIAAGQDIAVETIAQIGALRPLPHDKAAHPKGNPLSIRVPRESTFQANA